ncbi:hypothetical protein KFL_004850130 [Klebsormidium nitens]|uniref:NAD(P)-binding domain-containing protein n=1 Tax=Klebsormidium nitens TaxID=105231 RepID=A0A1Y1IG91_KLENI|nr:hypothetical protein KFL_004850130 [Klebsormidium nitens]|eukprot:GAQ89082.1 hypothetical protein KFL_004850130 [Klebsormidium nitens]
MATAAQVTIGSVLSSFSSSTAIQERHFSAKHALPSQLLGSSLQASSKALPKGRACRKSFVIAASAIEGPSTATAGGSGREFESAPKQQGDVSAASHSGYQNNPKEVTSTKQTPTSSSEQKHSEYNEGDAVKVPVDSEQKHAGYENEAEDAHAEKGGAQGHAAYKEGETKDPQGGQAAQSHAGYENPPRQAGGASKQGHSKHQASGGGNMSTVSDLLRVSGVNSPAGSRFGGTGSQRGTTLSKGVGRTRVVASAAGSAVAASSQKQSHAIKAPATVFVAGATGATGQKVVKALLARGLRVKAGVRNVNSAREKLGPPKDKGDHLELVEANITDGVDALASAIKGCDAVVSALGARPSFNFKQPWVIDYQANVDLAEACKKVGVKKLVVVSALLTNGAKLGQFLNPAFIFLNLFGLTLVAKHRAEEHIWNTDLDYTIVRPGGLDRAEPGSIVLGKEDTIFGGAVPREQVAEVAAEALLLPEASYKVVEVISKQDAPPKKLQDLFAAVPSVPH